MYELANKVVRSSVTVTGVQAKLSMDIETYKEAKKDTRFTIVGLWGGYILKPPSDQYGQLPEIEDVTMHLAEVTKIKTVSHSLIHLKSGELAPEVYQNLWGTITAGHVWRGEFHPHRTA